MDIKWIAFCLKIIKLLGSNVKENLENQVKNNDLEKITDWYLNN